MKVKETHTKILLKDAIDLISGRDLTKTQYNAEGKGIPYIMGASNIKNGKFIIERWTETPTVIGMEGDVILSVKGTVGQFFVLSEKEVHLSRQVMALRVKDGFLSEYVRYFLAYYIEKLKRKAKGMIPGITREDILFAEIPKFSLDKQKEIVNILEKSQSLIDKRKTQIALLFDLTQSVFLDMFGDLIYNSKGWNEYAIEDVCTEIVDCVNRTAPVVDHKTEFMMIRTSNIKQGYIDTNSTDFVNEETYQKWTRRLVPKQGDILFTREAPLGEVGLLRSDEKVFLGQRIMHYRPDDAIINPYYLMFHLLDRSIGKQINQLASGSTVKHLSVNDCKKFKIKLPPIELQKQFENTIRRTEKQIEISQELLSNYENMFSSLLQRAFKGELFHD
ncbi:restriction endonuclease subunit S [Bacillus sp. H1m]|uniref:restriction endonuclease subunit S n=1 Tax=Bacillus sp. H1m TaxID=1397277 RepID=UPI000468A207|nr:restriction endonuclease subunit S [Bacillus sp. H1m]